MRRLCIRPPSPYPSTGLGRSLHRAVSRLAPSLSLPPTSSSSICACCGGPGCIFITQRPKYSWAQRLAKAELWNMTQFAFLCVCSHCRLGQRVGGWWWISMSKAKLWTPKFPPSNSRSRLRLCRRGSRCGVFSAPTPCRICPRATRWWTTSDIVTFDRFILQELSVFVTIMPINDTLASRLLMCLTSQFFFFAFIYITTEQNDKQELVLLQNK